MAMTWLRYISISLVLEVKIFFALYIILIIGTNGDNKLIIPKNDLRFMFI